MRQPEIRYRSVDKASINTFQFSFRIFSYIIIRKFYLLKDFTYAVAYFKVRKISFFLKYSILVVSLHGFYMGFT